ncbi:MAG: ABC transporter permease [Clostridiaceae bacterium]|nr:ABC transporter permease [Clostridiaceae bacterium]
MRFVKLRKKKAQYILLGIIFAISVALFSVCTVFVSAAYTYTEKYYKGDSTPDMTIITANPNAEETINNNLNRHGDDIYNTNTVNMVSLSNNLKMNDKTIELSYAYLLPLENREKLTWKVTIDEGDRNSLAPEDGEIWIPRTLADNKKMAIGDYLEIVNGDGQSYKEKVTAIINDSNQPSTTLGITMIYTKDINKFKSLTNVKLVTLNTRLSSKSIVDEINSSLSEPINGFMLSKDDLIMCASVTPMMIGGIGLIASIILILILLCILRSNLWNSILREYKTIGIYKSIGMTYRDIKKFYINSYGLISILSSIIGLIVSVPVAKSVCNSVFRYLGKYKFDETSLMILITIFILFNILVFINLSLTLRKIKKIKPVEAINIGVSNTKNKLTKSIIKNTTNPFYLAINDIFKFKKNNSLLVLMFTLTFFISIIFVNFYSSSQHMNKKQDALFGMPKSDITISGSIDKENSIKEVIKDLEGNEYVDSLYYWNVYDSNLKLTVDYNKYHIIGGILMKTVFNEFDDDDYDLIEGRNPKLKNEIALNSKIMEANNLEIGDYFEMLVNGERKNFLITGRYYSMIASGMNLRVTNDAIESAGGNVAFIKLKDKNDYEKVKNYLQDNYDDIVVDECYTLLEDGLSEIELMVKPITCILLIGVLMFSTMNVINIIIGINRDNRKNYGILKALGVKNSDIVKRCICRILILTLLGAILGNILSALFARKIFTAMLSGIDIYEFNFGYTCAILVINILLVLITSLVCCRSIKKVSPVELIVD